MSKITIYSEACNKVDGYRAMGEEFKRKLIINRFRNNHQRAPPENIKALEVSIGISIQ